MLSPSTQIIPGALPFFLPGNDIGVLILHGYGGSIGDYRDFAEHLHRFGYTVSGPRLAGHGQDLQALRRSTISDWQQSIDEALEPLYRRCRTICIVGSSFGGVLALDAVRRKKNVHGLVIINTALSYRGGGIAQGILLRLLRLLTPYYPKRSMSDAERQRGQVVGSAAAWPINGILATAKFAKKTIIPALPNISLPVVVMSSNDDPIVGSETSAMLMAQLGSNDKTILTIPVTTHRPFRDPTATQYIAAQTHEFIKLHLAA